MYGKHTYLWVRNKQASLLWPFTWLVVLADTTNVPHLLMTPSAGRYIVAGSLSSP